MGSRWRYREVTKKKKAKGSWAMALEKYASTNPNTIHTDVLSEARQACYKVIFFIPIFILFSNLNLNLYSDQSIIPSRHVMLSTHVWKRNRTRNPRKSRQWVSSTRSNARNQGLNMWASVDPLGSVSKPFVDSPLFFPFPF